ncbi:MAG: hypothetical protein ACKORE_00585 [Bacteroidota bacterium]
MIRVILRVILSVILLFTTHLGLMAQSDGSARSKQKKAEKAKVDQAKKQAKADELGRKRHAKLQSKEVRKRWKRNNRRYRHIDSYDNRSTFWRRVFPKKRPSSY